ncbi:MAG: hypothetical protein VCA38_21350 [Roseibacillus sp.]
MSEGETIECRPTKWFYLRAGAMVTMFAVFLVLFMKDWKIGWPKKNEVFYTFQSFKAAKVAFNAHEEAGQSAAAWKAFSSEQEIGFPEEEGLLPSGVDPEATWPDVLTDYESYKKAVKEEGSKATPPLWTSYTDERGWSSGIPEKAYKKGKIQEQLYFGIGSGVLMLVGAFFLVRTSRRTMNVDESAYHAPSGERIPFDWIVRIDKRKWETKGLAYLYYTESGGKIAGGGEGNELRLKKAKVDGMVYGQFKSEDGAPADALFNRILSNFSGKLIELVDDDEEAEEAPPEDPAT